jgi:hypothetical protein
MYIKFLIEDYWAKSMFSRSNKDYHLAITSEGGNEYV